MNRRHDPFTLALGSLRARAEQGVYAPGGPIVILDEARRLKLSPTPVREALGWLCGFGLVERGPTGGFLAPRLDPQILRDRLAFRLHCLRAGVEGLDGLFEEDRTRSGAEAAPDLASQMGWAMRSTGNAALVDAYERVASQLAPFAPVERRLFPDHETEALDLVGRFRDPGGVGLLEGLAAYHRRRMLAAPLLVLGLESDRRAAGVET